MCKIFIDVRTRSIHVHRDADLGVLHQRPVAFLAGGEALRDYTMAERAEERGDYSAARVAWASIRSVMSILMEM